MPEIEFETTLNQDQRIVVNADVDLPCNRYTNDPDSDSGDVEINSVELILTSEYDEKHDIYSVAFDIDDLYTRSSCGKYYTSVYDDICQLAFEEAYEQWS
jgi:hypothetical protein|tara:strand:+ start:1738 stop:2037 length:300 start_codon:yes stop_codon:yes gene_type:complete